VVSAKIEGIERDAGKSAVRVNIRNTGERPITAFMVAFYVVKPDGERAGCGGRGPDMIDWSDPMPRTNLIFHMKRNWIQPQGSLWFDGYPRCHVGTAGETVPLESVAAELSYVVFDDGTGEGDGQRIDIVLLRRQQARDERVKWVARFSALRSAPALKTAAEQLYQDLVDATHDAEIRPDQAAREGMAKQVRAELQTLALQIVEWTGAAPGNSDLKKNEVLDWRITDLEQRTTRLVKGAGNREVGVN
jgi:hypothetical protein